MKLTTTLPLTDGGKNAVCRFEIRRSAGYIEITSGQWGDEVRLRFPLEQAIRYRLILETMLYFKIKEPLTIPLIVRDRSSGTCLTIDDIDSRNLEHTLTQAAIEAFGVVTLTEEDDGYIISFNIFGITRSTELLQRHQLALLLED